LDLRDGCRQKLTPQDREPVGGTWASKSQSDRKPGRKRQVACDHEQSSCVDCKADDAERPDVRTEEAEESLHCRGSAIRGFRHFDLTLVVAPYQDAGSLS